MKIKKEEARRIMSLAKTSFTDMQADLFWSDSQRLNYDDKILKSYCNAFKLVLKLDLELDLGTDTELSDITHVE